MATNAEEPNFSKTRAELFEAISHPARIRILQVLNDRPMGFTDLGRAVGIEGGGHLSFHLRKLAHLVSAGHDGIYALTGDGKEALRSVNAGRKSNKAPGNKKGTAGTLLKRTTNMFTSLFANQHLTSNRVKVITLLALLLLGGMVKIPRMTVAQTATDFGSLSVDHSVLTGNVTSAELPPGSQIYLWAFDTGAFRDSSDLSVGAKDSFYNDFALGGEVGESTSNKVSFSTNTIFHSIGGVGVSGFATETFRSVKTNPGVLQAGITVTPTQPSLVVVIALQAGDGPAGPYEFGGSPENMVMDQEITNVTESLGQPMAIAHAFLQPGTYLFTSSVQNTTGSHLYSYAEMMAAWVFTPASPQVSSTPALLGLPFWEVAAIAAILAVVVVAGVFALRRARRL